MENKKVSKLEKSNCYFFADGMILCIENSKTPLKTIRTNKQIQQGYQIQNQLSKVNSIAMQQ
jgi:hypothetical protein